MNETQVIINLISGDEDTLPDAYTALAASTALSVSDIPWAGPISEVRVAKIDGEYVINAKKSQLENATLEIIVAATLDNVMMVEGEAKECSEAELIEAIKAGHAAIKPQGEAQLALAQKVGEKASVPDKKHCIFLQTADQSNFQPTSKQLVEMLDFSMANVLGVIGQSLCHCTVLFLKHIIQMLIQVPIPRLKYGQDTFRSFMHLTSCCIA